MADNEIIKIGDVCIYPYGTENTSLTIVEVIDELSNEVVSVKFHKVIVDDSGNGIFTYLCDKIKTMNVSRKYLCKIVDLFNRQNAEVELLKEKISKQEKQLEQQNIAHEKLRIKYENALNDSKYYKRLCEAEENHGKWVDKYNNKYDNHLYVCSECGGRALYKFITNDLDQIEAVQELSAGCPHCFSKMDVTDTNVDFQ